MRTEREAALMPLDRRTFVKGALGASGAVLLGEAGADSGRSLAKEPPEPPTAPPVTLPTAGDSQASSTSSSS